MAKDMSCARVKQCSAASIGATERHNERLNTDYANVNVVQERIPLNVHYRSPPSSYMETLRTIINIIMIIGNIPGMVTWIH